MTETKTTLNVLYQSSDAYAMPTGVSMLSLFENNTDIDEINVYLMSDAISDANMEKIASTCEKYGRSLEIIDASSIREELIRLGMPSYHGSLAPYFKLFAFSELDVAHDRILYLDGDTIIDKSIRPLLDLGEENTHTIRAALDPIPGYYKELIGIPANSKYYNTGVLYVDCTKWRERNCFKRMLDHISRRGVGYPIADQDLINAVLREEIETIGESYNFNAGISLYGVDTFFRLYDIDEIPYYSKEEIDEVMLAGPTIYHCLASMTGRPWEPGNTHPQKALFDKYLKRSSWSEEDKTEKKLPLVFGLQKRAFELLPRALYVPVHKAILRAWYAKQCKG